MLLTELINKITTYCDKHPESYYITQGVIVGFALYMIYLESPKMGNVWYRRDDKQKPRFDFGGVINTFKAPFSGSMFYVFWLPYNWDTNPYMFISLSTLGYTLIRILYDKYNQ